MSRMKLLLDVVQDLRSLADSLQTLCDALVEHEYVLGIHKGYSYAENFRPKAGFKVKNLKVTSN